MLNKYNIKQLRFRCVAYVTFQEVGILIILDPEGKKWNGSHKNESPQPLADPRSRARVRIPSMRRGFAPIFGGVFIHVCGHPGSQRRLLWWRHCHEMTVRKVSFGLWIFQQMIYPSVLCLPQLLHPVVTLWNLSFSCTDFTPYQCRTIGCGSDASKNKRHQELNGYGCNFKVKVNWYLFIYWYLFNATIIYIYKHYIHYSKFGLNVSRVAVRGH